jgi:histidinol-phosphate aminotransferase
MSETLPPEPRERASADRPIPKAGIDAITPYKPGKATAEGVANPVKLSANENVLGSSPKAMEAYAAAVSKLNLYPDGRAGIVRKAVAEHYGLEPERLMFGCGSDELYSLLCQVYLEPGDNIVQGQYAFAAYQIGARACQAEVRNAAEPDYRIDVDEILKLVDDRTRLVFIANPGNPTGTWLPIAEIERLHAALPPSVILVHDAAYAEFALDPAFNDGIALARRSPNVVVTHTFSKIYGLAALRIGWGYADRAIVEAVDKIRPPFNTSIPAQLAAIAALDDDDFKARSIALVEQWRPWLEQQLGGLGLEVVKPTAANFVLVGFPKTPGRTAADADAFLTSRGLITRNVTNYGLPDHLRITIGLEEHNRALADALADFMRR